MKKDVIKRESPNNRVLYEEGEPLFPPLDKRVRRLRAIRQAFFIAMLVMAAVVCIFIGASVSNGGGETDGGGVLETETRENGEDTTHSGTTEPPHAEESERTHATESEKAEEITTAPEQETEELQAPAPERVEATDISEIERGEGHVVNYTSKRVDVQGLLDRGFIYSEPIGSAAPVVLVIHTHTSEQYMVDRDASGYKLNTVVAAGERFAAVLNANGLSTVHCTVIHDGDDTNAYLNARDTIIMMLKIYPTIKYVIDVHRMVLKDTDGNELRTQATLDGAAQIRLTVSTDIKREGAWQDDVSLALAIRGRLNESGQRACAPVVISHGGYNGDLGRFFLMADVGSSCNSVTEAMRAAEKLAQAFIAVVVRR